MAPGKTRGKEIPNSSANSSAAATDADILEYDGASIFIAKQNYSFYIIVSDSIKNLSQQMRCGKVSHRRSAKAQASLRACADSPEPLLLAYIKYECR